jgi:Tol biopolymer transport system component
MTASDRFDLLFADALQDLAGTQYPDYFDDALDVATRRSQRPAWTFLERWIPMDTATRRTVIAPTFPWRTVGLIVVIIALLVATAAVVIIGSQPSSRPAPPFGPAGNGLVVYAAKGDIFLRDMHGGPARKITETEKFDVYPHFSRDGTQFNFIRLTGNPLAPGDPVTAEDLWVANADGSNLRELLPAEVITGRSWSVDGSQLAVTATVDGLRSLFVINAADGSLRRLELGGVVPIEAVDWRPPDGRELIFHGQSGSAHAIYGISPDGSNLRRISAAGRDDSAWPPYAMTPDGSKLVYGQRDYTVDGFIDGRVELRILDLDTLEDRVWGLAMPPLEASGATYTGQQHWGGALISPDGKRIAFGRYWDDRSNTINHQVFVATLDSDGADAIPIGTKHRSQSGVGPFEYTWAPDGKHLIVQYLYQEVTWLADPTDGSYDTLPWGAVTDPPSWQRIAPE